MNNKGNVVSDKMVILIILILALAVIIGLLIRFDIIGKLNILLPEVNEEKRNLSLEDDEPVYHEGEGESGRDCVLLSVNWVSGAGEVITEIEKGESVFLRVEGEGCEGVIVSFEIKEKDNEDFEHGSNDLVKVRAKNVRFNDKGIALSGWIAEGGFFGRFNNPEYFFRVSLDGSNRKLVSKELKVI